ncbi:MAG TPA: hypothetical protein VLY46_04685 [Usitatibacter sp.]|nr:hypothetical protein [Usitatibacter sp.]
MSGIEASADDSIDLDRVLGISTVRDPSARAMLLSAVRDLGRDGATFTVRRLDQLVAIEDHFQSLLMYGQLDFLRQPFGAADGDRDFALNVQRIWLEAANGFQRFLRNRSAWAREREGEERVLHATGLAMNAIHGFVKWGSLLNEPGRGAPWRQLHALYSLAEADGYARDPFVLHASEPDFRTSVEALYLRALLFDMLNTGSLTKAQMEIADGWLAAWCRDYSLDAQAVAGRHFLTVDLAAEAGMEPLARGGPGANPRYLRADPIGAQIDATKAELRHGRVHCETGAGAVFPIEEHAALLASVEKLHRAIIGGGESRLEPRTVFEDREVDVTTGIERVMRKLREPPGAPGASPAPAAAIASMEIIEVSPAGLSVLARDPHIPGAVLEAPTADPEVQRWRVQDMSGRGYGLLVDRGAADGVLLHGIVALRNHETGGWIVGSVVRKQPSRGRGEVLVGIEVLGYRPIPVELAPESLPEVPAAFLPGDDRGGGSDALLLPLAAFRAGSRFALRAQGERYELQLNRITGKGADWISARFEIESKA